METVGDTHTAEDTIRANSSGECGHLIIREPRSRHSDFSGYLSPGKSQGQQNAAAAYLALFGEVVGRYLASSSGPVR